MMNLFSLSTQRAYLRTLVLVSVLFLLSFTVSGRQAVDPVPEKERTRGDFTANISLAFPVFSSGPEKFGYEAVGFGYTFLNNNLEAGINWRRASISAAWSPRARSIPTPG